MIITINDMINSHTIIYLSLTWNLLIWYVPISWSPTCHSPTYHGLTSYNSNISSPSPTSHNLISHAKIYCQVPTSHALISKSPTFYAPTCHNSTCHVSTCHAPTCHTQTCQTKTCHAPTCHSQTCVATFLPLPSTLTKIEYGSFTELKYFLNVKEHMNKNEKSRTFHTTQQRMLLIKTHSHLLIKVWNEFNGPTQGPWMLRHGLYETIIPTSWAPKDQEDIKAIV